MTIDLSTESILGQMRMLSSSCSRWKFCSVASLDSRDPVVGVITYIPSSRCITLQFELDRQNIGDLPLQLNFDSNDLKNSVAG